MHIPFETQPTETQPLDNRQIDPQSVTLVCPTCHSRHRQTKAGRTVNGAQRYQCQDCKRYYCPVNRRYRYPAGVREQAARLHADGKSLRQIARDLEVNPQTVVNWLRPDPQLQCRHSDQRVQQASTSHQSPSINHHAGKA